MSKLLKVYFIEQFKINRIYHNPNKKEKIKSIFMGLVFGLLFGLIGMYSYFIFYGLRIMNLSILIPGFSLISSFGLVFILNFFFLMPGFCFNNKEDGMILALPFSMRDIVSARLCFIYLISLFFMGLNLIPALIAMGQSGMGIQILLFFIFSFLFPLLPIALAGAFNAIITRLSSRFKYKNLMRISLTFVFLFCYFGFMMNFNQLDEQALLLYIENIATDLGYKFFLASWLSEALRLNVLSILKFIAVEVLPIGGYIWIMGKFYHQLSSEVFTTKKSGKKVEFHSKSILWALFVKDMKRYFSSSLYVVNTLIGSIFYVAFSICTLMMEPAALGQMVGFPFDREILVLLLPFIGMLFMSLSVTTSASLSIEGKNIWILRSLPVQSNQVYFSKLLVQLVQTVPTCIVCAVLLKLGLDLSFPSFMSVLLLPLLMTCFMGIFGLKMNQLFPNYSWKSESEVVKRGLSMTLTLFGGAILSGVLIFLVLINHHLSPLSFNFIVGLALGGSILLLIPFTMKHPI